MRIKLLIFAVPIYIGTNILSQNYTNSIKASLIISLPLTTLVVFALDKFLINRKNRLDMQLLSSFFHTLNAELSSGNTMHYAIIQGYHLLHLRAGNRQAFIRTLYEASVRLKNQEDVFGVIEWIKNNFKVKEGQIILEMLGIQMRAQGDLIRLTRYASQLLQEMNAQEEQLRSDIAKQVFETGILCIFPFVISYYLKFTSPSFFYQAFESTQGKLILLLSLFTSYVAIFLFLFFLSDAFKLKAYKYTDTGLEYKMIQFKPLRQLASILIKYLPKSYVLKQREEIRQVYQKNFILAADEMEYEQEYLLDFYAKILLFLVLLSTVFMTFYFTYTLPLWYGVLSLGFIVVFIQVSFKNRLNLRKDWFITEFPLFIGLLTSLLQSGLVMSQAFESAIRLLEKEDSPLSNELSLFLVLLDSGVSFQSCLLRFGSSCPAPDIQAAVNILIEYEKTGSQQALGLLVMQTQNCWQNAKFHQKNIREKQGLKFFIPMILNILSLVLLCVAPIINSFQI